MDQGKQDGLCQSLEVDGGCGEACLDLPKPLGTRVKTDLADAEMLARMAAALLPDLTPIKDQTIDVLRAGLWSRIAPQH